MVYGFVYHISKHYIFAIRMTMTMMKSMVVAMRLEGLGCASVANHRPGSYPCCSDLLEHPNLALAYSAQTVGSSAASAAQFCN